MSAHLFVEGAQTGAESRNAKSRCRAAVTNLLEKMGFAGRLPRITACGSRNSSFDKFQTALPQFPHDYIAMLIDSEAPISKIDETWTQLKENDGWNKPAKVTDDQVLLMTTCMETWIITDKETLKKHYGEKLQLNALPPDANLEQRSTQDVQECLSRARRTVKISIKRETVHLNCLKN